MDKVVQSLSAEADSGTLVEDLGNDAVLVHWHGSSDTAAHAQNLDSAYQTTITAMDQAANYEKAKERREKKDQDAKRRHMRQSLRIVGPHDALAPHWRVRRGS